VFRSPAGFHVLKLLELRGAGAPVLVDRAHVRHILVRTNELVSEDEAKRKLLALREASVNGVNSRARPSEFGRRLAHLGVETWDGSIQAIPCRNSSGLYGVEADGRKPARQDSVRMASHPGARAAYADMSCRTQARSKRARPLLDRKGDEAYQEWLRQLRDRAYVEMRSRNGERAT